MVLKRAVISVRIQPRLQLDEMLSLSPFCPRFIYANWHSYGLGLWVCAALPRPGRRGRRRQPISLPTLVEGILDADRKPDDDRFVGADRKISLTVWKRVAPEAQALFRFRP
jgi:hypothetical protein